MVLPLSSNNAKESLSAGVAMKVRVMPGHLCSSNTARARLHAVLKSFAKLTSVLCFWIKPELLVDKISDLRASQSRALCDSRSFVFLNFGCKQLAIYRHWNAQLLVPTIVKAWESQLANRLLLIRVVWWNLKRGLDGGMLTIVTGSWKFLNSSVCRFGYSIYILFRMGDDITLYQISYSKLHRQWGGWLLLSREHWVGINSPFLLFWTLICHADG